MVISGINQGVNTGLAAIYSGTVAAAAEGAFHGITSLAVSLASKQHQDFQPAAQIARIIAEKLIIDDISLPRGSLFNINVPPIPIDKIAKDWVALGMLMNVDWIQGDTNIIGWTAVVLYSMNIMKPTITLYNKVMSLSRPYDSISLTTNGCKPNILG